MKFLVYAAVTSDEVGTDTYVFDINDSSLNEISDIGNEYMYEEDELIAVIGEAVEFDPVIIANYISRRFTKSELLSVDQYNTFTFYTPDTAAGYSAAVYNGIIVVHPKQD